ncbi:MAG TPA: TetR/AcrR family transcriptional regulator [Enteractinococcus sp.]
MTAQSTATRGPGRPRIADHDEKILDAVVSMVDRDEAITVNSVVEASGVSRAALYRRWSSMTELVATALDRGRSPIRFDLTKPVKEAITELMFADMQRVRGENYSDRSFRKRIQLVMASPDLQEAYWQSHVHRRRAAITEALQVGVERGELRADLNVEAAIDGINGVFYYQTVVRGESLENPETRHRCREAFEIFWRGMQA